MSEFNNRVSAQRDILRVVNSREWVEELLGLSSAAIERWVRSNQLKQDAILVQLVRSAAAKLFFLANKSQEQVTEDYRLLSAEVTWITKQIELSFDSTR